MAVQAPAVDGRATESARRELAKALDVRASSVVLRTGAAARDKLFTIEDPPPDLAQRLANLKDSPP